MQTINYLATLSVGLPVSSCMSSRLDLILIGALRIVVRLPGQRRVTPRKLVSRPSARSPPHQTFKVLYIFHIASMRATHSAHPSLLQLIIPTRLGDEFNYVPHHYANFTKLIPFGPNILLSTQFLIILSTLSVFQKLTHTLTLNYKLTVRCGNELKLTGIAALDAYYYNYKQLRVWFYL